MKINKNIAIWCIFLGLLLLGSCVFPWGVFERKKYQGIEKNTEITSEEVSPKSLPSPNQIKKLTQDQKHPSYKRKKNPLGREVTGTVQKLSPEEAALLEEAFVTSSRLTDLMDSDNLEEALIEARSLLTHTNADVRFAVYHALDWIGKDAIYDMAKLIDDENQELAEAAMESFWEQMAELPNDPAKLNLLSQLSESADDGLKVRIAEALSEFHPYVAFNSMLSLLTRSSGETREDIVWEMESLTGESFESVEEWGRWFSQHQTALEKEYGLSTENETKEPFSGF